MKIKSVYMLFLIIGLLLGVGCAFVRAPVVPQLGTGFSQISAPYDVDFNGTTTIGSKVGEASSTGILGLVSYGDCSIDAAARNGKIVRVDHAGYEFTTVLMLFTTWKTRVYGE